MTSSAPQLAAFVKLGEQAALQGLSPADVWRRQAAAADWKTYAGDAQRYLDRPTAPKNPAKLFRGTPVTGDMLASAASNTYANTGTLVPLSLVLPQGHLESHFGTSTNSKARPQNPFNVGVFDDGTRQTFPTTRAGVQAYYDLMAKDYLGRGRKPEDLLTSFVNRDGNRYASDVNYEANMRKQLGVVNKVLGRTAPPAATNTPAPAAPPRPPVRQAVRPPASYRPPLPPTWKVLPGVGSPGAATGK